MKITAIRAIPLKSRTSEPGWEDDISSDETIQTLIEVVTDEGLTGIGSSYTSHSLAEAALKMLRPICLGQPALEPERLTEQLHQTTFWYGRGGAITHAISGIDMALWDLLGKTSGQPVARLLGGYHRDRVKAYGSLIFEEPGRLREKVQAVADRGFRAIKLGWGPFGRVSNAYDEELVRTARETVGPDVDLMVDAGASEPFWGHNFKWAIETAEMLATYNVRWFEEPLPPDDIEGYLKLRNAARIPISTGEVMTRRQSFLPWIEQGALDIVQPDCSKCGGLSEARRIGWAAYDHNIALIPHGWNNAVGLAADLALVSSLPLSRYVEYLTPTPLIDEIVATPFVLDADGCLPIPTGPGLGIELDPDGLARHAGIPTS
jgi:L-alanine-DL-glutamate epimerase-like enolase superfamily enzyme